MRSEKFMFRVWVHPVDGDPPDIEVWYPKLEDCASSVTMTRCLEEVLANEDFHKEFDLDDNSHWQVMGEAEFIIYGGGALEDYDEEIKYLSIQKMTVPDEFFGEPSREVSELPDDNHEPATVEWLKASGAVYLTDMGRRALGWLDEDDTMFCYDEEYEGWIYGTEILWYGRQEVSRERVRSFCSAVGIKLRPATGDQNAVR